MERFLPYFARLMVVLTALPIHEYAHGLMAYKLGDDTPRLSGRLTLNPMAHLDIIGTVMILFFGIGYAKPVPVNPYNFTGNRKAKMAFTAFAGPLSNLIMSFISLSLSKIVFFSMLSFNIYNGNNVFYTLSQILKFMASINISLAVFNLIPIYPLDGSRIFGYFIPDKIMYKLEENSQAISIGLFVLLYLGFLTKPIMFLSNHVYNAMNFLTGYIDSIFKLFL